MFEHDPDHKLYGQHGERIGFTDYDLEHKLEHILKATKALRDNLAALVDEPDADAFSTILSHPDLSFSNILADTSGKINALIDWEGVFLQPPHLLSRYPLCLESNDRDYDGIMKEIEHDPRREEILRLNLDDMILTRLRKVFRVELEELKSPYLRVFEEESEYQEGLYEMVWNRAVNGAEVPRRVEIMVEVDDESDECEGISSTSVSDVAKGEMKDVKVVIENDDNWLAEETSRVEDNMSKAAEVVKSKD